MSALVSVTVAFLALLTFLAVAALGKREGYRQDQADGGSR